MKGKREIASFLYLTIGAIFAAFAIEEFLVPVLVLDGGVVGVSMIISQLTGIKLGILTFVLNIPFLIIGLKNMGKGFFVSAIYSMILFSIALSVFTDLRYVTEDALLGVVFGGVLLGLGVGFVLRGGGCLDGTETIALLLSKKTSFSVGQVVFIINIFIYATAGILFGWDRALYSLLTYFISFKIIDMVEEGLDQGKAAMIITQNGEELADEIYKKLGRTCTIMDGQGLISSDKKCILYCVITRIEVATLRKIVSESNESAFVTITDVSEIVGNHVKKTPGDDTEAILH